MLRERFFFLPGEQETFRRPWQYTALEDGRTCVQKSDKRGIPMTSQITVDTNQCVKDGACVAVCSCKDLALNPEGFPEEVADAHCILCGHCVAVCPTGALTHAGLPPGAFLPAAKGLPDPALIDNFLLSRRSVREFKQKPIAKETLEALLDLARRSPTASNSQKVRWIAVNDADKVRALSAETINWARAADSSSPMVAQWENGYDYILRGAPALVVAIAPEDYAWAKQDSAIALTFLELAAEARGLGVCWAGILTRAAAVHAPLRQALSVPEGYIVCGGLMLGEGTYKYRLVPTREPLRVQWI
jgi:nitroreductase/NAD-dependent dihydropyrimidine dehydrogenase PreA subunit